MELLKMLYSDFIFWLKQQPQETQFWTIAGIIGSFAILLIIGIIADHIKRKREEQQEHCKNTSFVI